MIYNEDCRITMKRMSDKSVDLILTDPPYGVDLDYDVYQDSDSAWYDLMDSTIPEMRRVAKMVIMPSCQIKRLGWLYKNHEPDWLMCWYKGSTGTAAYIGFNDWEPHLVYGRRINRQYMHDYFATKASEPAGSRGHPCPKPESWAEWVIARVARDEKISVYDPFSGSGTVGAVAIRLGHSFVGSELSSQYAKQASDRILSEAILKPKDAWLA